MFQPRAALIAAAIVRVRLTQDAALDGPAGKHFEGQHPGRHAAGEGTDVAERRARAAVGHPGSQGGSERVFHGGASSLERPQGESLARQR